MEDDVRKGPVDCVGREDIMLALKDLKTEKTFGTSNVSLALIAARVNVGVQVSCVRQFFIY